MNRKCKALTVAGALLLSVWVNAISIELSPSSSSVTLGTPVDLELRISGLGNGIAPSLGTFDITLEFNPLILGFSSFAFGDPGLGDQLDLPGLGSVTGLDSGTSGQLNVFEVSLDLSSGLDSLQAPQFALGTVSFNTVGIGTSGLQFTSAVFGDALGNPLLVQLGRGSIEVFRSTTAVPDTSSSALLLALGLVGSMAGPRVTGRGRFGRSGTA
jgi:hypothetical protein